MERAACLMSADLSKCRLSKAGWSGQEDVAEYLVPASCCTNGHSKLHPYPRLPMKFG